jgi:hypothetical protein
MKNRNAWSLWYPQVPATGQGVEKGAPPPRHEARGGKGVREAGAGSLRGAGGDAYLITSGRKIRAEPVIVALPS